MRIKSQTLSMIFKFIIFICAFVSILIECGFVNSIWSFNKLYYYGLFSTTICALYFLLAGINTFKTSKTYKPLIKGMVIILSMVNMFVFHFLLSNNYNKEEIFKVSNILIHYVIPIMTLLDWLLFDEKGKYNKLSSLKFVILPNIYFILIIIISKLFNPIFNEFGTSSNYPYHFIDIDVIGFSEVIKNVIFLNLIFIALGYAIVLIDKLLSYKKNKETLVGIMFIINGKLLLVKPRYENTYLLLGGKTKEKEKTLQACIRYCYEQLGDEAIFDSNLFIKAMDFEYEKTNYCIFKYNGVLKGKLKTSEQIETFLWYDKSMNIDLEEVLKEKVISYCNENKLIS